MFLDKVSAVKEINDPCDVSGVAGTCKLMQDCLTAVYDLKYRGKNPQICGFKVQEPIVCCTNIEGGVAKQNETKQQEESPINLRKHSRSKYHKKINIKRSSSSH